MLIGYIVIINAVTFIAFGIDKAAAVRHRWRIREKVLLGLAFAGGSVGGIAGMYLFRHKIRKKYFAIGIPLMLALHFVIFLGASGGR